MESHPLFAEVSHVIDKYPGQAGSIWQAYLDLKLCAGQYGNDNHLFAQHTDAIVSIAAQRWEDLEIKDLEDAGICLLLGRNPKQATSEKSVIYPMSLAESTSMSLLELPFTHLRESPDSILLAIASEDSSIVYYKIAKGIVAPKEVKD